MTSIGERVFRTFTLGSDVQRDVELAIAGSRNGGHVPVAVWINPDVPEITLDGLLVVRHRNMSKWMVYVEESEPEVAQLRLL